MTEAFEHFSSGFIFLEFTEAFRHRFLAVQFWQVVVNAVNKHTKTDRFVRRYTPKVAIK